MSGAGRATGKKPRARGRRNGKRKVKKRPVSEAIRFRAKAIRELTNQIGVYALCDLDNVPIYVGKSEVGILSRVRRHLTSARSDIIANRLVDVWEVAYVRAWPVDGVEALGQLEANVFRRYDSERTLMNGSTPKLTGEPLAALPDPSQVIQLLSKEEIESRRRTEFRLPRQVNQIANLIEHILEVKDNRQLRRSLRAHFERLDRYRNAFLADGDEMVKPKAGADE